MTVADSYSVNQTLEKNQIYAADADFEFVKDFLLTRCSNAKVIQ